MNDRIVRMWLPYGRFGLSLHRFGRFFHPSGGSDPPFLQPIALRNNSFTAPKQEKSATILYFYPPEAEKLCPGPVHPTPHP